MPGKRYSDAEFMRAIMMIAEEGMTTAQAAEKSGITLRALQRYRKKLIVPNPAAQQPVVEEEKAVPAVIPARKVKVEKGMPNPEVQAALEKTFIRRAKFLDDVFETKQVVLDRIRKISKKSDQLDALQRSLKTLNDIESEVIPKENDTPPVHAKTINMFQFFNQKLKDENYEGPELTDADIVKGD